MGSTIAASVYLVLFFPYYAVAGLRGSESEKTSSCLSAPVCFSLGAYTILQFEGAGVGIHASNGSTMFRSFSYNSAMGMLLLDTILYLLLGLYFNQVLPSEWGTQRPWYFLVTKEFWFPNDDLRNEKQAINRSAVASDEVELKPIQAASDSGTGAGLHDSIEPIERLVPASHFESVSAAVASRAGVKIRHLRKAFGSSITGEDTKVAVRDVCMDFHEGEITCLLGHNGAGKSTLINCLVGLLPITRGHAHVFSHSVNEEIREIRHSLGVCSQQNILYDQLTLLEHLYLYGTIKGMTPQDILREGRILLTELGLKEKENLYSNTLSGGQKRKLMVAIALIGNPKLIILDEFSSGLDLEGQRLVWNMLKKRKQKSAILFTTHQLREAEALGDRVAIMHDGNVKCFGSSLFLKSLYGVGYTLTIVKAKQTHKTNADGSHHGGVESSAAEFNESAAQQAILSHVPGAECVSNVAGEISFRLPTQASPQFPELFELFDSHQIPWGISSYGIAMTTLEEVFLRVGKEEDDRERGRRESEQKALHEAHSDRDSTISPSRIDVQSKDSPIGHRDGDSSVNSIAVPIEKRSADALAAILDVPTIKNLDTLWLRHIRALYIKRVLDAKRNRRGWIFTVLLPFLILILGLAIVKVITASSSQKTILMTPSQFNQPYTVPVHGMTSPASTILDSVSMVPRSSVPDFGVYQFRSYPQCINSSACNSILYSTALTDPLKEGKSYFGAILSNVTEDTTAGQWLDQSTILINTTAVYSLPIHWNLYSQRLLQYYTSNSQASIRHSLSPLPPTANERAQLNSINSIFLTLAFSFIPAHFIHYTVHESAIQAKHQQYLSGVDPLPYWIANYLWDFTNYLFPAALCLMSLAMYNIEQLLGDNSGATIVVILLYGLSIISFTYLLSFVFSNASSAQNTSLILYVLTSTFLLVFSIVLDIIPSTRSINRSLKFLYRLFPTFCFGEGIASIMVRESISAFGVPRSVWDMEVTGYPLIFMAWETVAYFALVLIVEWIKANPEWPIWRWFVPAAARNSREDLKQAALYEDQDVVQERQRVEAIVAKSREHSSDDNYRPDLDFVTIHQLRKVYADFDFNPCSKPSQANSETVKVACANMSLGIEKGEIFGLLGVNGAGKTTALKALTNEITPTSGMAWFDGRRVKEGRKMLGYCAQFEALHDSLTAREQLTLFARIKGIEESAIPRFVQQLIDHIGLQEGCADRPSGGYSGGNRRKLSAGIALVGSGNQGGVLLLDEITSSVDPASRRKIWSLIAAAATTRAVVLTTHSMEEAEALCQRIGIMVAGRLRCLGTPQHLRSQYAQGYQLDVNLVTAEHESAEHPDAAHIQDVSSGADQARVSALRDWVKATWPGSVELEANDVNLKFRIPQSGTSGAAEISLSASPIPSSVRNVSIAEMFRTMEHHKQQLHIREYSVSETTLEQIFLYFANESKRKKDKDTNN